MEEMDKQRKEEFKQYEMKKKAEQDHKLAVMSPEERATAETLIAETEKRHNNHEKLNHPGGREQLEEVWEEKDQVSFIIFVYQLIFVRWKRIILIQGRSLLCMI